MKKGFFNFKINLIEPNKMQNFYKFFNNSRKLWNFNKFLFAAKDSWKYRKFLRTKQIWQKFHKFFSPHKIDKNFASFVPNDFAKILEVFVPTTKLRVKIFQPQKCTARFVTRRDVPLPPPRDKTLFTIFHGIS